MLSSLQDLSEDSLTDYSPLGRFLMKCANETVTIELKNGAYAFLSTALSSSNHNRHNHPWHNHVRFPTNEHGSAHSQNDTTRSRSNFS